MAATLSLHGRPVETYFDLLGNQENSITATLGWVLKGSPRFRQALLQSVLGDSVARKLEDCGVHLQQAGHCGYTDIELVSPTFHLIIEAKRGWNLPGLKQLTKYCPRFPTDPKVSIALLSMSECSKDFAERHLPPNVEGKKVFHRNWRQLYKIAGECAGDGFAEKHLLDDFRSYLRRIVGVQNQESNIVYVVSLTRSQPDPDLTYVDMVEKYSKYYHPFGERNRWPNTPSNYIGFRYDGRLQTVHHVDSAGVIEEWDGVFPGWTGKTDSPLLLYSLGPALRPAREVRSGPKIRSARLYAALDLLLTSPTVLEAVKLTKARLEKFV